MLRTTAAALMFALLVSAIGCSRVPAGAATGAVVGAGAGVAICDWSGGVDLTDLEGAGIGAAVGGLLGALIASATEEKESGYQQQATTYHEQPETHGMPGK